MSTTEQPAEPAPPAKKPADDRPSPAAFSLRKFDATTQQFLKGFDRDKDGKLDIFELTNIVDSLVYHRLRTKWMFWGVVLLTVFTLLLLGSMFGLTWAVIESLKDTKITDGVLTVKSTGEPLLTRNMDFGVGGAGVLQSQDGTPLATREAAFEGDISSLMSNPRAIKTLYISNLNDPTKASLAFKVAGVLRKPESGVTVFITQLGHLEIKDNKLISAEGVEMKGLLTQGGYTFDATGRRLLDNNDGFIGGSSAEPTCTVNGCGACSATIPVYYSGDCYDAARTGCGESSVGDFYKRTDNKKDSACGTNSNVRKNVTDVVLCVQQYAECGTPLPGWSRASKQDDDI